MDKHKSGHKSFSDISDECVAADQRAQVIVAKRLIACLQESVDLIEAGKGVPDCLNESARTWVAVAWTMYREGMKR